MSEEIKKDVDAAQEEFDEEAYWDEIEEEEEEEAKKRRIKIVVGVIVAILVIIAAGAYVFVSKAGKYQEAVDLYAAGQYAEAAAAFEGAGAFQDAAVMAEKSYYLYADELLAAGDLDGARAAYAAAGDYDNAPDMVAKCDYKKAVALFNAGETEAAMEIFAGLGDYNQTEYYVSQAALAAKYANYVCEDVYADCFGDWRAAENAFANALYGTWYNLEDEALEINEYTLNGQAYTVELADGFENRVTLCGALPDGTYFSLMTAPAVAGPVDAVLFNDEYYYNVTAEQYAAALEAKENGEFADYEVAQKYADNVVTQKALDLFVGVQPVEEAAEAEEAAEVGMMDKVMALVPAHYVAENAAVTYDAQNALYFVTLDAVYVTNLKEAFCSDGCEATPVYVVLKDNGTGLNVEVFAYADEALELEAADALVAAAEAEEAAAEEAVEEAPAEEAAEEAAEAPAEEAVEAEAEAK